MFPVKMQLDKMDMAGVDKTVLFCTAPHPERTSTLNELEIESLNKILAGSNSREDNITRMKNNILEVVKTVKEYPSRFLGICPFDGMVTTDIDASILTDHINAAMIYL